MGDKHILVHVQDGNIHQYLSIYFHVVRAETDPTSNHSTDILANENNQRYTPTIINASTAAPFTVAHYKKYPDASLWKISHAAALQNFETERVIK